MVSGKCLITVVFGYILGVGTNIAVSCILSSKIMDNFQISIKLVKKLYTKDNQIEKEMRLLE